MSSVVDICNMALAHIRAGSINSLDQTSVQAQQCKLFYETARDQCLRDSNWGFNHSIRALSELTDVDIFGWRRAWQYPGDCLHINNVLRDLEDLGQDTGELIASRLYDHRPRRPIDLPRVEYRVFNYSDTFPRVIATMEDSVRIDYRKRVTDTNLFGADFVMSLSYLLGSYIAIPIAGVKDGRQLRSDALSMYTAFRASAADDNANQQYAEPRESEFITVRE
jgi:hypothetical protein